MFGWIYLILAVFLGREITRKLVPENKIRETKVAPLWVTFPAVSYTHLCGQQPENQSAKRREPAEDCGGKSPECGPGYLDLG